MIPSHETIEPEPITIPTDDQMDVRVSADMPTAVFSTFADNTTGAALVKRLAVSTSAVDENTRMILFKGKDIEKMSDDQIEDIADMLFRRGYVAIETPTTNDMLTFVAALIVVQTQREEDYIDKNFIFGPDVNPETDVAASLSARYNARMNTMQSIATRAGIDNPDGVLAEMVILSNTEYFYQQPGGGEIGIGSTPVDDEGNAGETKTERITFERTPTSVQVIAANVEYAKYVFKNNQDILQQFAQEQNVEKYTLHWRSDNPDIELREGYSVEVL